MNNKYKQIVALDMELSSLRGIGTGVIEVFNEAGIIILQLMM